MAPSATDLDGERARAREFWRRAYSLPFDSGRADDAPVPEPVPSLSSVVVNPSSHELPRHPVDSLPLAAFAQLGALRLNAERCVISFYDEKAVHVYAESTRTTSLLKTDKAACVGEDLMFTKAMIWPRGFGMCEVTIALKPSDPPAFVINNVLEDDRFKDRPFVVGKPYVRSYAGVPIKSPEGHNIGSYCILDNKPRDGLDHESLTFMQDMASAVMRHLELAKAKEEQIRASKMVIGLGRFIEGKSSIHEPLSAPWGFPQQSDIVGSPPSIEECGETPLGGQPLAEGISRSSTLETTGSSIASTAYHSQDSATSKTSTATTVTESFPITPMSELPPHVGMNVEKSDAQEGTAGLDLRGTFCRAARIIKEACEVQGAVFFDASMDCDGLMEKGDCRISSSLTSTSTRRRQSSSEEDGRACGILGSSTSDDPIWDQRAPHSMTEALLKRLIRTYGSGEVFNFEGNGTLASNVTEKPRATGEPGSRLGHRRNKSIRERLQQIFPRAKSLAFCPLWDSHRNRFFAAVLMGSTSPKRVFTHDGELNYLAAFGNSVMAEVARLDAKMSDRAKGDFISSISHELRSPLHGILGSLELLRDTKMDPFQASMTRTIQGCGQTMLDTINHVLDYAKIDNITSCSKGRAFRRRDSLTAAEVRPESAGLTLDFDLSAVTEQVLETVFAGFSFRNRAPAALDHGDVNVLSAHMGTPSTGAIVQPYKSGSNTYDLKERDKGPITVIVDIDNAANWNFNSQPGAWRRVIMNLFSNSLKYTHSGFIKVTLEAKPLPSENGEEKSEVTLTVRDSGKGMSKEYLRDRLFKPFAQEDSMTPGVGLGLSIIKQIVKYQLGGEIDVQSQQGVGTEITVVVPLTHARAAEDSTPPDDGCLSEITARTRGLKASLVGFGIPSGMAKVPQNGPASIDASLSSSVISLCSGWFGIHARTHDEGDTQPPGVYIATEEGAEALLSGGPGTPESDQPQAAHDSVPLIVLCQTASSIASSQLSQALRNHDRVMEFIAQPCGPRKLAKALAGCLDHRSKSLSQASGTASASLQQALSALKARGPAVNTKRSSTSQGPHDERPRGLSDPFASPTLSSAPVALAPPSPSADPHDAGSEHEPSDPPSASSLSILLVDDNPVNLKLLEQFAKKMNHTYAKAKNGQEAFDLYRQHACPSIPSTRHNPHGAPRPAGTPDSDSGAATPTRTPPPFDFVLMDHQMPVLDGPGAARLIRAFERERGIAPATIVALTGLDSREAQLQARASGIDAFLTKPVSLKQLKGVLGEEGEE